MGALRRICLAIVAVTGCVSQRSVTAKRPPELGRMQIFQRATGPADADAYVEVTDARGGAPIVTGRFPVRGLELELPVGTYRVTTWFGADVSARCETEAIVAPFSTTAFVRVQDDRARCHFESGEAAWNVALRRGRMKASSWWVGLAYDGAPTAFLELGMPLPVSAVFLDVPPDANGSFHELWIAASLRWEDSAALKACTEGSDACASFYESGGCRGSVRATVFDRSPATELVVNRLEGAKHRAYTCLITD